MSELARTREAGATRRLLALVIAGFLALTAGVSGAATAHAQEDGFKHTFDKGHTDIFNTVSDGENLDLKLKEDITGSHVVHDPEEVLLKVKQEAWNKEQGLIDLIGEPGYFLPQTQNPNLLWPGWDTQGSQNGGFKSIDFHFESVEGPGKVFLFTQQGLGSLGPRLDDGDIELKDGSILSQSFPAHEHTNWAFTKPGHYVFKVRAQGENDKGELKSSKIHTYTWEVGNAEGDAPIPGAPQEYNPNGGNPEVVDPEVKDSEVSDPEVEDPNKVEQDAKDPNGGNNKETGNQSTGKPKGEGAPADQNQDNNQPAPAPAPAPAPGANENNEGAKGGDQPKCVPGEPALIPKIKDDREQPATWRNFNELTFGLGDSAHRKLPKDVGPFKAGSDAWMIASSQQPDVPWVGANTQNESVLSNTTGNVTWELTGFNGPGAMYVYTAGVLGEVVGEEWFSATPGNPSGSHVIPANTHVHPNWVFEKPGRYEVKIKQTTETKEGKTVSGEDTVVFEVDGQGNANSGHFDIGAEYTDGAENCAGGGAGGQAGKGGLANTGVSSYALPISILAFGVVIAGAGMVFHSRVKQATRS